MNDALRSHLASGIDLARRALADDELEPLDPGRREAMLPLLCALVRMWGSREPQRAAGALATFDDDLTRAAGRAATMEFAPWPLPTIRGVLTRAERDAATAARIEDDPEALLAVFDAIAIAWARHAPHELSALRRRLHDRRARATPHGLWAQQIRAAAASRQVLPDEAMLHGGDIGSALSRTVRRLGPLQRVRDHLVAAVELWPRSTEA